MNEYIRISTNSQSVIDSLNIAYIEKEPAIIFNRQYAVVRSSGRIGDTVVFALTGCDEVNNDE